MNLSDIVRHYIKYYRECNRVELDWFRNQISLEDTIRIAALADNRGKRFRHQTRIPVKTLEKAKEILSLLTGEIKRCNNFDELLNLVEANLKDIRGVGELYYYDTSLRIGAKLDLLPEKVYLHSGTRIGARILGYNPKSRYLETGSLPNEFQALAPHEIEDILCIYKDELKRRSLAGR
jgi:hypothetical protein